MSEARKKLPLIICVALLSAAIAFPAGLLVSSWLNREGTGRSPASFGASAPQQPGRSVYSPNVIHDPYVVRQQTLAVEAMELRCRQLNEMCPEARQARKYLDRITTGD